MRLLVIGAAGMLGQDLLAAARAAGHEPVGLDLPDIDITDAGATLAAVRDAAPDAVVNCAAWTCPGRSSQARSVDSMRSRRPSGSPSSGASRAAASSAPITGSAASSSVAR